MRRENAPKNSKKRLESFIKKTHDGKLIMGYGGIEKYYTYRDFE